MLGAGNSSIERCAGRELLCCPRSDESVEGRPAFPGPTCCSRQGHRDSSLRHLIERQSQIMGITRMATKRTATVVSIFRLISHIGSEFGIRILLICGNQIPCPSAPMNLPSFKYPAVPFFEQLTDVAMLARDLDVATSNCGHRNLQSSSRVKLSGLYWTKVQ